MNNPVFEFARDNKLLEDGYDAISELKIFHEPPDIDAFKQLTVGKFPLAPRQVKAQMLFMVLGFQSPQFEMQTSCCTI